MAKVINLDECITFGVDMGTSLAVNAGRCVTPGNTAWTASVNTDKVVFVNVFKLTDGVPDRGVAGGEEMPMVACGDAVLVEITSSDFQGTFSALQTGSRIGLHTDGKYIIWSGTQYIVGTVVEKKTSTAVIQIRTGVCAYE